MGKCCLHASSFIFYQIIIKVASNQDRHKSSDEFDFGPDQTTHFGVTCPWMTKILHFRTWISLRSVDQSWSNFMCSIMWGGERLHNVLRQIGSKLWYPWQQKTPLTYNGENGVSTFSRLLLIWSFLYLKVTRTCKKISDKFEFRPDRTTDYEVSCPLASKTFPIDLQWENGVSMLACLFLIESPSKLLVTRTGIKAQSSSILGQIRRLILELLALEWRKFHTFELEYLWSQLASLDQILCVALLGWGKDCIRFWGTLTLAHWTQVSDRCPLGYLFFYWFCSLFVKFWFKSCK